MSGFGNAVMQHLASNAQVYGTAAVALAIAVVKSMPPEIPRSLQDLWTWLYESLQTVVPAPRNPTPPVTPAPTK